MNGLPITPPRSNYEVPQLPANGITESIIEPESAATNGAGQIGFQQSPVTLANQRQLPQLPSRSPQEPLPSQTESVNNHETGRSCNSPSTYKSDVDTGFLQVYGREHFDDARNQALKSGSRHPSLDLGSQASAELLNIYAETYFEDCYAWCPVLDRETLQDELSRSPVLQNALALLGSHIRPPMLPHDSPVAHYDRARRMIYEDEEQDTLACLKSILLFYWWAPRSPAMVHRHSSWWWTSVVIRHAQQLNVHRAAQPPDLNDQVSAMWRRSWWTAFARERLTALCQSKPPIINPEDCSIPKPSLDDFPLNVRDQTKPLIFINWVGLCDIIGRIARLLSRSMAGKTSDNPSPLSPLAEELGEWIRCLPPRIRIDLASRYVSTFDKDAYQMHIPYLASVIVLNLTHGSEPSALPVAVPPAIFAASCVARIFKDILAKGDTRFLMPITSWYCGVSFIALVSASRDPVLGDAVKADLEIITLMCDQLRRMWASAQVIYGGFERLRAAAERESEAASNQPAATSLTSPYANTTGGSLDGPSPNAGIFDWICYFPFATKETSRTVELLLEMRENDNSWTNTALCSSSSLDAWDWFNGLTNADFVLDNDLFNTWTG